MAKPSLPSHRLKESINGCFWFGFRFILDESDTFSDSTVVDVGSGCGASSIAAVKAGAELVICNDVDIGKYLLVLFYFICFSSLGRWTHM